MPNIKLFFSNQHLNMYDYFFALFKIFPSLILNYKICIFIITGNKKNNSNYKDDLDSLPALCSNSSFKYGRFDTSALHIAHALKQTEIQKSYHKSREKSIDFYLVRSRIFQIDIILYLKK